jgi:threonine dehydrogenase-like Zn-dependent dehydrogenase
VASVDDPSVSIDLLSVVVTGLGMAGLFFIPAASSRQLPEVIRQRTAERRAGADPAGLDDA